VLKIARVSYFYTPFKVENGTPAAIFINTPPTAYKFDLLLKVNLFIRIRRSRLMGIYTCLELCADHPKRLYKLTEKRKSCPFFLFSGV
jgi:hypothetical protein